MNIARQVDETTDERTTIINSKLNQYNLCIYVNFSSTEVGKCFYVY